MPSEGRLRVSGPMAEFNGQNGSVEHTSIAGRSHKTAHDWEGEKNAYKDFFDDGTMTFFWRAHRLLVLVIFSVVLIYVALFEERTDDTQYNTKRGMFYCVLVFILFGVTHTPDGPFKRPHPALWRFMCVCSIVYELSLIFILFQSVDDARQLLKHIDPKLGEALPEKSYGGNCHIYDHDNKEDPWHNVWDKMDGFVTVHFFGWWLKTLVLRDWWLCLVISIMFEVLEYTLEHQLPNFSECWWDHWLMDALICNGMGIYLGMKTLNYLSMKPYHWRGMWNIPSYRGKFTRVLKQFTPYIWTDFDWRPTSSLKRWIAMLWLITMFLLAELNTFYLKFVLWIPPPHFLCLGRLVFFLFWGAVAMRETFQFLDDPNFKKFGTQTWIVATIILTEVLITVKFDWDTITQPLPQLISIMWIVGVVLLGLWTVWNFYVKRLFWHTERKLEGSKSGGAINGNYLKLSANGSSTSNPKSNGLRSRMKKGQ